MGRSKGGRTLGRTKCSGCIQSAGAFISKPVRFVMLSSPKTIKDRRNSVLRRRDLRVRRAARSVHAARHLLRPRSSEKMISVPVRQGEGPTGRLAEALEPIQLPDIFEAPTESRVRDILVRASYRTLLVLVRE